MERLGTGHAGFVASELCPSGALRLRRRLQRDNARLYRAYLMKEKLGDILDGRPPAVGGETRPRVVV